jgi:hypothetical protein
MALETRPLVNVIMDHERIDKLRMALRLLRNYVTEKSRGEAAEVRVARRLIDEALNARDVKE